ncbi:vomeronasal type-2 receptor 26-like [Erythrolamprus reginae]|uniref:vomeronasal type-2 receptor 26-like n=1 Tax=Erythrolamprus reginae TaxID=121349 RepID=UPI00396CD110
MSLLAFHLLELLSKPGSFPGFIIMERSQRCNSVQCTRCCLIPGSHQELGQIVDKEVRYELLGKVTIDKISKYSSFPRKAYGIICKLSNPFKQPQEYYQIGDFIIGGVASQSYPFSEAIDFKQYPNPWLFESPVEMPINNQHILSLVYAVKEINRNPKILPNISLGFHISNSYIDARMIYLNTLKLLSSQERTIPNYSCEKQNMLPVVIGESDSEHSLLMANILITYKIPQVAYCFFAIEKDARNSIPYFYRMVPGEAQQFHGIVQLLLHFQWTWVGIVVTNSDKGEKVMATMLSMFSQNGICAAFMGRIQPLIDLLHIVHLTQHIQSMTHFLQNITTNVIVMYSDTQTMWSFKNMLQLGEVSLGKVWIITAHWDFGSPTFLKKMALEIFHGALSFTIQINEVPGFQPFLELLNVHWPKEDASSKFIWEKECLIPCFNIHTKKCVWDGSAENLPKSFFQISMTGQSYSIYNSVYAIAHVLHNFKSSRFRLKPTTDKMGVGFLNLEPWKRQIHRTSVRTTKEIIVSQTVLFLPNQLYHFLSKISFNNSVGDHVSFNENGELKSGYDITNLIGFPNKSYFNVKVGRIDSYSSSSKPFVINEDLIVWHKEFKKVPPSAVCNEKCHPGYSRKKQEGKPFCCYDCIPCPAGKISDQKDMDDCFKCPEDQYPNRSQDKCLIKSLNFLTYDEALGISLALSSCSFALLTTVVLGIFIKHRNTPIVKANNLDLSYLLLISLLFCFLSSLLFIGRPGEVICPLRQIAFAITFSIAISCVLAKTITVVLAFMATKPGSAIKKWIGKKLSNYIVLFSSLIQTGICISWICIACPYPDMDMTSLTEEIILECNKGSIVMFCCIMSYLGSLAVVSFITAFLARKLPNSFNEAKFITFSMLVFCNVWIFFVPTYLSSKGKYMVAVEIFALLSSSAGLLGCIFLPKCYIIVLRPELNKKNHLTRKNMGCGN